MRALVLCLLLGPNASFARAQDAFPDVPGDFKMERLQFRLMVLGMEDPRHGALSGRPATNAEFAQVLIAAVDRLPKIFGADLGRAKKQGACPETAAMWRKEYALYKVHWREPFQTAVQLLQPEIKALGRNPKALNAALAAAQPLADQVAAVYLGEAAKAGGQPLFTDVPVSHWAWDAVQELRDAGVLSGYPDGSFGG